MISVISPAKTLDFESPQTSIKYTQPEFIDESEKIMARLKKTSRRRIGQMMDLSKNLVDLNFDRYQDWKPDFNPQSSKQVILAFKGDVYIGLEADTFNIDQLDFAQEHLRILSGLHGILKPLDLIRPYRLEMGTPLKIGRRENLYAFWKDKLYHKLNSDLEESGSNVLINLASNEYFNALDLKKLNSRVIKVEFKDFKNGDYKVLSFFAKKARGMMAKYIIENKINDPESLKNFNSDSYIYSNEFSDDSSYVFLRG
jgi:uncharacterized protein